MRRLLVLVAASVLTGCTTVVGGTPLAVQVEQRGPKGSVPAGLERFYAQSLSWQDCVPFAHDEESQDAFGKRDVQCARLEVPLDYAKPDGRSIIVGLLRRPAEEAAQRIGSLVINPGGPGASGMASASNLAADIKGSPVAKRFDIVGFDPRGIGASEPRVRCLDDAEWDAERLEPVPGSTPQDVAREETENRDLATKCTERSGADLLANVGTRDVVKDMDVMRSALGDEKLTYLGYSYGTRIGTAYAEAFPGSVRALVLDGAIDPQADPVTEAIGQIKGFEEAFDAFVKWCVEQDECALGKSAADADKRLDELAAGAKATPITVGDRKLSYTDIGVAIAAALYSEQAWETLNTALTQLADSDGETLLLIADLYLGRGKNGKYSGTFDANTAITCVDEPRVTDRAVVTEQINKIVAAVGTDSLLLDTEPPLPVLDVCAFWPAPVTSQPHQPAVPGLPQVLVVSTTGDPATPYQAGVALAKALGGRLLTYEATQHTAFLQGNDCVDDAGTKYLVDLQLPPDGTRCS